MAIKQMDISLFDKITASSTEDKTTQQLAKEEYLSQSDMDYLYEKGIEELKMLNGALEGLKHFMLDMFCGSELVATEESLNFFCSMEMFTNELIPAMLNGDEKEVYKYCSEEVTEEDLETSREEFFSNLYTKYLKR